MWVVLGRGLQAAMRRSFSDLEAIRQIPAGRSEYLPSRTVSIADPLQWLMSGNRQPRKGRQRNLLAIMAISYPDDLWRFQSRRLAVS